MWRRLYGWIIPDRALRLRDLEAAAEHATFALNQITATLKEAISDGSH